MNAGIRLVTPAEQALLDAVAAAPKDDAPRLAYADWLEPSDPELAEFIRLDCQHERDSPPGTLRRKAPWLQELERWVRSGLSRKGLSAAFVRRGFVEGGGLTAATLVDRADAIFDRAPALCELRVQPQNEHMAALARLPHLEQLTRLSIEVPSRVIPYSNGRREPRSDGDVIDDEALALVIASPHLRSLESLSFVCASVGPATARALAASSALDRLRILCIEDDLRFDAAAARELSARPRPGLLVVRLARSGLGPEGCASLAASGFFASVETISLDGAGVGPAGARALSLPGALARCRRLALTNNDLGDEGAGQLAEGGGLADLEALDLSKNRVGNAGAAALAGLPGLQGLRELTLTDNCVGNEGALAFANSPHLNRLRRLNLDCNAIAEAGAAALATTQRLPALTSLGLANNALYADETEVWTDWNGSPVGSGPVRLSGAELQRRYGARFKIS